jgi:hypothetical protein
MHPYITESHYVKYAGLFTSTYAIDTISIIPNEFIGDEFYPSPNSVNGYEAMGFDVRQLTQDKEPSLFTLKTNMPIPMLVYGDSFQWEKNGHHILPSSLDLECHNKPSLH